MKGRGGSEGGYIRAEREREAVQLHQGGLDLFATPSLY